MPYPRRRQRGPRSIMEPHECLNTVPVMSIHPLTWFNPSRIGGNATQLLGGSVTLARVLADRLADDVPGVQSTGAVALSYRGVDYEIDLTEKDATGLDRVLAPY